MPKHTRSEGDHSKHSRAAAHIEHSAAQASAAAADGAAAAPLASVAPEAAAPEAAAPEEVHCRWDEDKDRCQRITQEQWESESPEAQSDQHLTCETNAPKMNPPCVLRTVPFLKLVHHFEENLQESGIRQAADQTAKDEAKKKLRAAVKDYYKKPPRDDKPGRLPIPDEYYKTYNSKTSRCSDNRKSCTRVAANVEPHNPDNCTLVAVVPSQNAKVKSKKKLSVNAQENWLSCVNVTDTAATAGTAATAASPAPRREAQPKPSGKAGGQGEDSQAEEKEQKAVVRHAYDPEDFGLVDSIIACVQQSPEPLFMLLPVGVLAHSQDLLKWDAGITQEYKEQPPYSLHPYDENNTTHQTGPFGIYSFKSNDNIHQNLTKLKEALEAVLEKTREGYNEVNAAAHPPRTMKKTKVDPQEDAKEDAQSIQAAQNAPAGEKAPVLSVAPAPKNVSGATRANFERFKNALEKLSGPSNQIFWTKLIGKPLGTDEELKSLYLEISQTWKQEPIDLVNAWNKFWRKHFLRFWLKILPALHFLLQENEPLPFEPTERGPSEASQRIAWQGDDWTALAAMFTSVWRVQGAQGAEAVEDLARRNLNVMAKKILSFLPNFDSEMRNYLNLNVGLKIIAENFKCFTKPRSQSWTVSAPLKLKQGMIEPAPLNVSQAYYVDHFKTWFGECFPGWSFPTAKVCDDFTALVGPVNKDATAETLAKKRFTSTGLGKLSYMWSAPLLGRSRCILPFWAELWNLHIQYMDGKKMAEAQASPLSQGHGDKSPESTIVKAQEQRWGEDTQQGTVTPEQCVGALMRYFGTPAASDVICASANCEKAFKELNRTNITLGTFLERLFTKVAYDFWSSMEDLDLSIFWMFLDYQMAHALDKSFHTETDTFYKEDPLRVRYVLMRKTD